MCMLTALVPIRELSEEDMRLGKLLFTNLILRNASSNRDGFGLASTNKAYFKTPKSAFETLFSSPCIAAVTEALPNPLIGHVRTTSTGRNAKDGSHPFFVGPLAVAHNGTFTNYRVLLKANKDISTVIDDPDPVDSHVFAHLLSKIKGKGALTSSHIEATLKEMEGSYALLVAERDENFIWVIRGGNALYHATVGPFQVINTSQANLTGAVQETAGVLKLLFNINLEVPKATAVESYGIYRMWGKGLAQQADLPKPAVTVVTYNYGGWQGGTAYRGKSPKVPSASAISRSNVATIITSIPGITYEELEIATKSLCETTWYETKIADLAVVQQTLEVLSSQHYSKEKALVWAHVLEITGKLSYESVENILTLMGSNLEVYFPYFLHTVEELETILNLIRGGDNVIIS